MIKLSVWRLSRRQEHFSLILTNVFSVSGHATMRCDKLYEIRGNDTSSFYAIVLWYNHACSRLAKRKFMNLNLKI